MKTLSCSLLLAAVIYSMAAIATPWAQTPGKLLPPFFRHIGIMPLGDPGFTKTLWDDYAKSVTTIVVPLEEVIDQPVRTQSMVHFLVDIGKWEFATHAKMMQKVAVVEQVKGRFAAWVLNGDVGSMVTNLREFEAFAKQLTKMKPDVPLFLACPYQMGSRWDNCLPKSLERHFAGVIWDLRFTPDFDPKCWTKAIGCREKVEAYFAGMLPKFPDPKERGAKVLNWSLRVPLSSLATVGDPLKLLKALYAFFVNENRSVHFMVGLDAAESKKLLKGTAPYAGIGELFTSLTAQHIQRNTDLGSDIESPLANESRPVPSKTSKALASGKGWELGFGTPFLGNRFTILFAPKNRPSELAIYGSDGDGEYFLGKWILPRLDVRIKRPPVKLFTETYFFPRTERLTFFPTAGKIDSASARGWVLNRK